MEKKNKRTLGLKVTLSGISWALVERSEDNRGRIIETGCREIPLTVDEKQSFERVKANKESEERHLRKSTRRRRQRYIQRRNVLMSTLEKAGMLDPAELEKGTDTPELRAKAATEQIGIKELGRVLMLINKNRGYKSNRKLSSNDSKENDTEYKQAIKRRSDELKEKGITIGQWLMMQKQTDRHATTKGFVFFRKDHEEEFDRIWNTQKSYYPEILTDNLYRYLKKLVIFYQRDLKSMKHLVSVCPYESKVVNTKNSQGRNIRKLQGRRVAPKSSPLFQEYRIWNDMLNIRIKDKNTGNMTIPSPDMLASLAERLKTAKEMKNTMILKALGLPASRYEINFDKLQGNLTIAEFHSAAKKLFDLAGHTFPARCKDKERYIRETLAADGLNMDWLDYDSSDPSSDAGTGQMSFRLWHLLYSYKEDKKSYDGEGSLREKISELTGATEDQARVIAGIRLATSYASLSHKAMRRMLPFMKEGTNPTEAAALCGYRYNSTTSFLGEDEEGNIGQFPKNSLRNPIAEKIANQFLGIVRDVCEAYGHPDGITMEYSRELKASRKARLRMLENNRESERKNRILKEEIIKEFNIKNPSKNDIERYKLYKELEPNGYRALYSNRYIPKELVFEATDIVTKDHIIPKTLIFDDSWANLTLEYKDVNSEEKKGMTAIDFIRRKFGPEEEAAYRERVELLYKKKAISEAKRDRLLMSADNLPEDIINKQIQSLPYALKATKELLERHFDQVTVTIPAITNKIANGWGLDTLLKEESMELLQRLGLASEEVMPDGRIRTVMHDSKQWSSKADARATLVQAVAVAFTKRSWIQYLNGLQDHNDEKSTIKAIEKKETAMKGSKRIFLPPMPLDELQERCREALKSTLVSIRARNRLVSTRINRFNTPAGDVKQQLTLVPRGRLHAETLRSRKRIPVKSDLKIGKNTTYEAIQSVCNKAYRNALKARLDQFGGNPEEAFTGKNSILKKPVWLDELHLNCVPGKVKCITYETYFTVRKPLTPELFKTDNGNDPESLFSKVFDKETRDILTRHFLANDSDLEKAFGNLADNPVWKNQEQGIRINNVTIGEMTDKPQEVRKSVENGKAHYAEPDNNDHTAVYKDQEGNYHARIVTFMEAVNRRIEGKDAIDKEYNIDKGWEFIQSFRKNEMFVIPEEDFDPREIDLTAPENRSIISPHLFRMQSMFENDYKFRLHYDRNSQFPTNTKDIFWKRVSKSEGLARLIKVRIDRIGRIHLVNEI